MKPPTQSFLRWDHGDRDTYYAITGQKMQDILSESFEVLKLDYNSYTLSRNDAMLQIELIHNRIVTILREAAATTIPARSKNFYKFWWSEELYILKENSMASHKLWLDAGKPRCGPIACNARSCKLKYKQRIRECQKQETLTYTNDLHEALLRKEGASFWKCWRAKFDPNKSKISQVDGLTDSNDIVNSFETYFSKCWSPNSESRNNKITSEYLAKKSVYCGSILTDNLLFDIELIDSSVRSLKCGKAAGLDGISAEHIIYSHPSLYSILYRLFNAMITFSYVPVAFGLSYTVPLLKNNRSAFSKCLTTDDFRGISISSVLSKLFEMCILDRYSPFFETADNQFGFKKHLGCSNAVYSVNCLVNGFVSNRSTVNLCALDLQKAFEKMPHHALFLKLMNRMIPSELLLTLDYWFSACSTCVKWDNCFSNFISLKCGVRQGVFYRPVYSLYV